MNRAALALQHRLGTFASRRLVLLAALLGALTALGQAPFNLWPLALLSLAGQFLLLQRAATARQAVLWGWAAGVGYFALALHWIVEPFLVDIARHGWMAPFALVLMAAGLALFWGGAHLLAFRLGKGALAWGAAMALAELARSYLFTGFPWALLGHIWIDSPLLQWAAFVGPHGLTLMALAAACCLACLRLRHWSGWAGLAVWAAAFVLALGLAKSPDISRDAPVIRLVQPNAPQHLKWDPDHIPTFFRRQITATAAAPRPDLIIWPETSVPVALDYAAQTLEVMAGAADGVPLVFGIQRYEGAAVYNSAAVLEATGAVSQVYDKHHLVPFGEYVPFGDLLARFGIHGLAATEGAGFSAGPGPQLLDLGPIGAALPLICYEAVFPNDVNAAPRRPALLLQITNDAWFGQFSGPYQHLAQARLRAVEQGLPLVRAANTGVSAMIDAKGRITGSLPLDVAGHIDLPLPPAAKPTVYARAGDFLAMGAIILLLLAVVVSNATGRGRNAD